MHRYTCSIGNCASCKLFTLPVACASCVWTAEASGRLFTSVTHVYRQKNLTSRFHLSCRTDLVRKFSEQSTIFRLKWGFLDKESVNFASQLTMECWNSHIFHEQPWSFKLTYNWSPSLHLKHKRRRLPVIVQTINFYSGTRETRLLVRVDGTTALATNSTMETLQDSFRDRILPWNVWPPRSPYLSSLDFYRWDF
jgi:hypothetical protein